MPETTSATVYPERLHALRKQTLAEADITSVQNQDLIQSRREQICDAALELFLEKGFAATTIRDICARSGVNQASIYDYIANKNDILRRLLNQLWFREDVPTLSVMLQDQSVSLEDAIEQYFRECWAHKRKGTLLAYRCVPHMQAEDRHALHAREYAAMKDLADQLSLRLGIDTEDRRLDIVSNLMVFLSAFGPMRDWLNRDIPNDLILRSVAVGAAAMVRSLVDADAK
ncbi:MULTISPECIES: TetR/AcrR family transcriptional regulator [unclassified Sulfitobacter]|jgi:AcrR family transcriptional regulator|uniref:TetR/AcrR family transcriptional regulator n=1 Tax=unclassified Sulfitobacter TaxID=196795 RepID=UPI00159394D8|nr:TetR/AcrR family transcriptional regulator [Sulfitobacter sp. HGT1]MBQ0803822.1 TetR/AcrR family transcriptional regulator [Sulfitobacter sp.]